MQKIRIHIPTDEADKMANPFVATLMNGVKKYNNHFEIFYGIGNFWDYKNLEPDIIHFHWPDLILDIDGKKYTASNVERRIIELKKKGVKIVAHCHNLKPHYSDHSPERQKVYDVVYRLSDLIIHLGEYSYKIFFDKYKSSRHIIIPHHIFNTIYDSNPLSNEEINIIRKKWGIPARDKVVLTFGAFRAQEERNLLTSIMEGMRNDNVCFIAPQFYRIQNRRNKILLLREYMRAYYLKIKYPKLRFSNRYISNSELPGLLKISDIVLIQRLHVLNSGNLALGFLFGKTVVGPNVGNVGHILKQTQNPCFDISNGIEPIDALKKGFDCNINNIGKKNKEYAFANWSTEKTSQLLYLAYTNLFQ